ncbi:MAG: hypothetical protein M1825_002502 [Sarcosagium campestre]|nr:MAG: hypothetical protein M1825_002502 [Sarcosagium campestre]
MFSALALFAGVTLAVQPVEVRGPAFVNSVTGAKFQIIGVDYQPGGQSAYDPANQKDPLSDPDVCLRDAALMQNLGLNTIRIYNLDPTLDHDLCVSIFNEVGIYLILDVNAPMGGESLDRTDPKGSYHVGYLERIFGVVEAFKGYPNTLAFFGGNEVINEDSVREVPKYIRAVQRDLKNYIAKNSDRAIPVGYSAADVRDLLSSTWEYFQCAIDGDQDDQSRSDFFGLNSYSWCGPTATFETAGYDDLVDQFRNTTVPVFLSEYGCNEVKPRVFNEVGAVYGPRMTQTFSGGLVYEYSQEEADYGLVDISDDDGSIKLRTDYDNLQEQFAKLDIAELQSAEPADTADATIPECDSSLITASGFSSDFNVPPPPRGAQALIDSGIDNPNQGKLVDVSDLRVKQTVQDSTGKVIPELAIKPLPEDQNNVPSIVKGSEEKPAAGSMQSVPAMLLALAAGTAFMWCM